MKIALLSGPSGSGKSYVEHYLRERMGDRVTTICYDELFRVATQKAFPYHNGKPNDQRVWHDTKAYIQHHPIFSETLQTLGKDLTCDRILIQGYQVRRAFWRNVILNCIPQADSAMQKYFAIVPDLETLMAYRQVGNDVHQYAANVQDCQQHIAFQLECHRTEPPERSSIVELKTKEEALERIHEYLDS